MLEAVQGVKKTSSKITQLQVLGLMAIMNIIMKKILTQLRRYNDNRRVNKDPISSQTNGNNSIKLENVAFFSASSLEKVALEETLSREL